MFDLAGAVLNNTWLEQVYYIYLNTTLYKSKPQHSVSSYQIIRWLLKNLKYTAICGKK